MTAKVTSLSRLLLNCGDHGPGKQELPGLFFVRKMSVGPRNAKMKSHSQLARYFGLSIAILAICTLLQAGTSKLLTGQVDIPKVSTAPTLNDYLDGRQRSEELRISEFSQRDPYDGEPAISPTTAYISYDDKNIYAVFVCKDAAGKARAHIGRRDDLTGDETVSLLLDTFHDGRHAYEFIANPLGVQMDGMITEGQDEDFTFDTVWHSEGRLTNDGYVVMMAIPFKSLRFRPGVASSWGVAFGRIIPTNNESDTWPHLSRRVESYVPQFAATRALSDVHGGSRLQLIPYVFASRQKFLDSSTTTPFFHLANEFRGGVDAKYVFHDGLTFDFTANPDFSQIESDEPQVTINQRYENFFPERRPFFTESAGYFQTPENLFFSRRVVDPQFGTRMTGKASGWTIGLLSIDDRSASKILSGDTLPGRAHVGVERVQRDLGRESTIGVLFSQYSFGSLSNRVYSVDSRIKLNPNWVATAQGVHSFARDLDGSASSGNSFLAELAHIGRHLTSDSTFRDRSPGFRADLGFIPRVDIRLVKNETRYRWHPERGALLSFGPSLLTSADWDHSGQLQDWSVDAPFTVNLKRSTTISAGRTEVFERFQNLPFRQNATYASISSEPLNWASLDASYSHGTNINYFPGENVAPFLANSDDADLALTLRPTSRFRLSEAYLFDRLRTIPASTADQKTHSIFNNHLLRTKISYQFTRAMSIRAIVDYNAVLANPALVDLERTKRISTDFLFTYAVNPGTAVYVGYSEQFENLSLNSAGANRVASPGLATGRQLFVKVSYLFQP